jgi:hypothetical protein
LFRSSKNYDDELSDQIWSLKPEKTERRLALAKLPTMRVMPFPEASELEKATVNPSGFISFFRSTRDSF